MSLLVSSSSISPFSRIKQIKFQNSKSCRNAFFVRFSVLSRKIQWGATLENLRTIGNKQHGILKSPMNSSKLNDQFLTERNTIDLDWEDEEEVEDTGSPWEGAVIYRRNPSVTHVEYCTTLERLGLGKLSTEISKSRASVMGLRVTKAVKDYPYGTPVQISFDVTRKKKRLRLDGIIKSVITLGCNRCGKPAAECIFSNFSLLLNEEQIEEPEIIDIGDIFRENKISSSRNNKEDDDDSSIDWDDRLYFPPEEQEIDISKHVRDMVHLEITINAVCDPMCKGICLKCGTDWNRSSCNCSKEVKAKGYGPLGNLKKQMQGKNLGR